MEQKNEAVETFKEAAKEYKGELKAEIVEFKAEVVAKAKEEVKVLEAELTSVKAEGETLKARIISLEETKSANSAKNARMIQKNRMVKDEFVETSVAETINKSGDFFAKFSKDGQSDNSVLEIKAAATITSANLVGQVYGSYLPWQPGMEPLGQTRFRDIFRTIDSDTDTVYYPRARAVNASNSSFGVQVTEGSAKSQVDRTYDMITLTLQTIAGYATVSRQSLRNIKFLSSWLPTSMNEQLQDTEDTMFVSQLIAAGIGTYTPTSTNDADQLISIIKNLMVKKFKPNFIICDPAVWASLMQYKGTGSGEYTIPLGGTVALSPTGQMYFLGIPLYPVNWLTGGRVIVGDSTKAAIVESEGLTLRQSNDVNDNFIKNLVTFLLERVEGLAIFRPDGFITSVLTGVA